VPLAHAAGAVEVDRGPVPRLVLLGRADARGELVEIVLEARRRDDLEDPAEAVARVPEGVPLVARLEGQVAGLGVDDVLTEEGPQPAFQHIAVLVLAGVAVQGRGQVARRDRMLDQREPAAGLLAPDQEPDPDHSQVDRLAVVGADDPRPL
jgi:hypothetical protein